MVQSLSCRKTESMVCYKTFRATIKGDSFVLLLLLVWGCRGVGGVFFSSSFSSFFSVCFVVVVVS